MNVETSRREVPGIQGLFISTCLVFKRGLGMENIWYAGMGGAALGPRSTSVFQYISSEF